MTPTYADALPPLDPADWQTLAPRFAALEAEPLDGIPAALDDWLRRCGDLLAACYEAARAASRAKDVDTADTAAAERHLHFVREISPRLEEANQKLRAKLLALPDWQPAMEHREMARRMRAAAALFREENVPLLAQDAARGADFGRITGPMTVTLGGEEMPIPRAQGRLQDANRAVREEAWRAIMGRLLQDKDALDAVLMDLIPLRRTVARNAGLPDYQAYAWQRYGRLDYTPDDVRRLHEAVEEELLPVLRPLLDARRQRMGVDSLRPWDAAADPDGLPPLRPFSTADELAAGTERIFRKMDPELGEQFGMLNREGWLDLDARANKAPGGYSSHFPVSKRAFIFWSATGTVVDVTVLLHEAGHAFHSLSMMENQPLLFNHQVPIEFAEVASMAMELLAAPFLAKGEGGFFTPEDARRAERDHLLGALSQIRGAVMNDAFQQEVYRRDPAEVTPEVLDRLWSEQTARFSDGTDWTGLEREQSAVRLRIPHLYLVPFYMIEYSIAQIGALQVWRNARRDGYPAALQKYRAALALGGTRPLPELYDAAGARLAFDRETVGELARLAADRIAELDAAA